MKRIRGVRPFFFDQPRDFLDQGGILQHEQMRVKDARILRSQPGGHLALHVQNLVPGVDQGLLEALEFFGNVLVANLPPADGLGLGTPQHQDLAATHPRRDRDASENPFS